ncbi:OadG family protein [Clostridium oceanicum]|uniref:Oxaloacetate decarboxylase (Na(+) extruding) n=1 Tax=Clostridium oceanicum TaxID=1543 RepID=A0ABP3UFA7_9CLOT
MFNDNITILQALNISGICIIIVFSILIFIALVLNCFKFVFKKESTNNEFNNNSFISENNINEKQSTNDKTIDIKNLKDEEDIVAVISAVVKASKDKENSKIRVKSLKRIK